MLRGLKSTRLRSYLNAYTVQAGATSGATYAVGGQDFDSTVRNGTGDVSSTLGGSRIFSRVPVVLTASAADTAGSFAMHSSSSASTLRSLYRTAAGGTANNPTNVLYLGFRDHQVGGWDVHAPVHSVKGWARSPRVLTLFVGASGASNSYWITSEKTATGVYDIRFKNAFARRSIVIPTPISNVQKSANIEPLSGENYITGLTVKTYDINESAEDNAFYLIVYGWDASDEATDMERVVQLPYRAPRVVGGVIAHDAAILNGSGGEFTAEKLDTGIFKVTLARPFVGEPIVGVCGNVTVANPRAQLYESALKESFTVYTSAANGTATDSSFCFIAIGQDSSIEYSPGDSGAGAGLALSTDVTNT